MVQLFQFTSLSVYKITKEDLDVRFITNTTEYYECEFICGENVSNLNVTASIPEALTWISTSRVRVTENCLLNWSYDFTFDGVVRHWVENIDIELFNSITINELFPVTVFLDVGKIWLGNIEFFGTNVNNNLYLHANDMTFKLDYVPENSLYRYNSEAKEIVELSGLASLYIIDTLVLENIICE